MDRLYNCHTHIFNIDHSPERFLEVATSKRMAKIARFVMQLPLIRKFAANLILNIKNPMVSKYASFVFIGTRKSQNHVYRDLRKDYSDQDKFVILTLNMDYQGAGDPPSNYAQQIYEIKRVKRNNPDSCLPFYSVDPRAGSNRENAAAARDHIVNKGFAGIKIYPALGFYPFDKNLQSTYKFAKDNNVPIMTHCTRVGSYYLGELTPEMKHPKNNFCKPPKKWPDEFPEVEFPINKDLDDNAAFCDNFSYPYNYAWVLEHEVVRKRGGKKVIEKYDNLKICFAHAGDDPEIIKGREIKDKTNKDPRTIKRIEEYNASWFTHIKYLIRTYKNVYTDISFTLSENKIFEDLYKFIADPLYTQKILFGTDFYMTMMKKKEKPLVEDFRKFLFSKKNGTELWRAITYDNPREYLTSKFYTPPDN